ncbi:MAG: phosphoenolpyruvate--protein phosphotransferase [Clostridia bacterium]|nr:phosphoenolpyruvate--protein phosphotransferase [Clostridia bacterium]
MSSSAKHALYRGIGIGESAVYGKLRFLGSKKSTPAPQFRDRQTEERDFRDTLDRARAETEALRKRTLASAGAEAAAIFEIHEMLLSDPDFIDLVISGISKGLPAAVAVSEAGESLAAMFESIDDEYLSARAADMRDIASRVRAILLGESDYSESGDSSDIIVARDLTPAETAKLDPDRVAGFVTFAGSVNSHTAILARAMDIPALIRAEEFSSDLNGAPAILDARTSTLSVFPTPEEMSDFADELRRRDAEKSRLRTLASLPAVTKSGKKIALYANIGSLPEAEAAYKSGAEGIGLFRSEFLFIGREDLPSEEEQFRAYREAARLFADRPGPVVIRTLDIGADKVLPALHLGIEDNPALGSRGIRLCLAHPELFRAQLRAILRASAFGKTAIMLPMISTASEIAATRKLLSEEKNRLRFEEVAFDESIELGIMIETPAAAIMARELGRECDFFSVGTNDLFQYTLAADRQNQSLSYLYTEGGEAVMRLIRMAADGIHASGDGKWLGICGEMAADTALTEQLISLGADELSVSPPYIARVKERIREID